MTLVALANALLGDRMVERFHADPRVQATELLLQERVPRDVGDDRAAPARRDARRRAGRVRAGAPLPLAAHAVPARAVPLERQLRHVVTNAGGGASFWRGLPVTRWRRDATRDPDGQFIYLRDVRSGAVWSATYQPTRREPDDYLVDVLGRSGDASAAATTTSADAARHRGLDRRRRRGAAAHGPSTRARASARSTSPATPRSSSRRPPTTSRIRRSASCSSKPSTSPTAPRCSAIGGRATRRDPRHWAFHVLSLEGRPQGPVEWETDRARFLGRGPEPGGSAGARRTRAVGHDRLRARSDRQPAPAHPAVAGGVGAPLASPPASPPIARPPRRSRGSTTTRAPPSRTFALAFTHAQSGLRHLGISSDEARAVRAPGVAGARHRRLAARGRRRRSPRTSSASRACGRTPSPATCRSCSCASSATTTCRWCGRCCRRRSTGGSRG